VEKYYIAGQVSDRTIVHTHCMLDTLGYKYTVTKCNSYCFTTATMVARSSHTVTLYLHFLNFFPPFYISLFANVSFDTKKRLW